VSISMECIAIKTSQTSTQRHNCRQSFQLDVPRYNWPLFCFIPRIDRHSALAIHLIVTSLAITITLIVDILAKLNQ
jgi:hypothetical protein